MIQLRYNLRMYLKIIAILVIFHVNYNMAACFRNIDKTPPNRDYANKIGMICWHKFELKEISDQTNGSFFIEVGKNDEITESLKVLGTKRKIIFFIFGFGVDFKPKNEGDKKLEAFTNILKGWCLDKKTVVCGFDYIHTASVNQFAQAMDYPKLASERVPFAAGIIADIMRQMYDLKVFKSFEKIQLIGFSLGCHVAGFVGRNIKRLLFIDIPRIFALDPPHTFLCSNKKKLLKTDAKYIQAIYSSRLGLKTIDAHCKIILNDGITQPICRGNPVKKAFCSHEYLYLLYNYIARRNITLHANKDPGANNNDENVPDDIIVGHLNPESICGVFNADTTKFSWFNERIRTILLEKPI